MALYGNMQIPAKGAAGGALPTRQAPEGEYVVGQSQSARLSAAGGAAAAASEEANARALGSLAQGIDRFGRLGLEIHRKNEEIDLARAQGAYAKLQMEGLEERTRLSQLHGEAAIGADGTPDVEAQWRQWHAKAVERLSKGLGERGKWYFDQHAGHFGASNAAWAAGHVENEQNRFLDAQLKLAIDAEGQSMAADPSGASWPERLGRLHGLNEQRARQQGWNKEMLDDLNRQTDQKAIAAAIDAQLGRGDLQTTQSLVGQYGQLLSPEQYTKAVVEFNSKIRSQAAAAEAAGDVDTLETLANLGSGARGGIHGAPSYTGNARILAYRESGSAGSMHVSYGLVENEGVDVGKYSFITGGKRGGRRGASCGEFIRWCGQKKDNPTAQLLYNNFYQATGGDWDLIAPASFWKAKGEKLWRDAVRSNPRAFEALEDGFQMGRMNATIKRSLRPEVQKAIADDKTGAIYEMVLSTLNQHDGAVNILNGQWRDGNTLEEYIKAVYLERAQPWRFKGTKNPRMGITRFFGKDGRSGEYGDVLAQLHGKFPQSQGRASQNQLVQTQETRSRLDAARIPARAQNLYNRIKEDGGTPQEQWERFMAATEDLNPIAREKLRKEAEPWYRAEIKQEKDADAKRQFELFKEVRDAYRKMKPVDQKRYRLYLKANGMFSDAYIKQLENESRLEEFDREQIYLQNVDRLNGQAVLDNAERNGSFSKEFINRESARLRRQRQEADRAAAQKEKEARAAAKQRRADYLNTMYAVANREWRDHGTFRQSVETDIYSAAQEGIISYEDGEKLIEFGRNGGSFKLFRGDGLRDAYNRAMGYSGKDRRDPPADLVMDAWEYFKDRANGGKIISPEELRNFCADWMQNVYTRQPQPWDWSGVKTAAQTIRFPGMQAAGAGGTLGALIGTTARHLFTEGIDPRRTMPAGQAKAEGKTIYGIEPPLTAIARLKARAVAIGENPEDKDVLSRLYARERAGRP